MAPCHFLLIVIVTAIRLIYKEFFKNTKMCKMLLRIGFVKLLIFRLFSIFTFDVIRGEEFIHGD